MLTTLGDWPDIDSIDLMLHDLPHDSSSIEWWYLNSHLATETGDFSLFAAFFRRLVGKDAKTQRPCYAHSVLWAIIDATARRYHAVSMIDPNAPTIIRDQLDAHQRDESLLERGLREMLSRGNLPYPDQLITEKIEVRFDSLYLDFGGNCLRKCEDGSYQLTLQDAAQAIACDLRFQPSKPPVRHGDNGLVRGASNEGMFYYFIPRCHVEGSLMVKERSFTIQNADGWYDHEFGEKQEDGDNKIAWNWISTQLDNGYEVSAYDLYNTATKSSAGRWAVIIDPSGESQEYTDFTFAPSNNWTSLRTFNHYPLCWDLSIPAADMHLSIQAAFAEQEFVTLISAPSFWEGRVQVTGEFGEWPVNGLGFVERSGYTQVATTEEFFGAVGQKTRYCIQKLLPLEPTREQLARLVGIAHVDAIDSVQYAETIIQPLRTIIDRGGKTWRSYALIACCEIVGGDVAEFEDWLIVPELLHVGSLIVDDVQDKSTLRRGGPAAHILYGEPLAINAGTAAYFIGQLCMSDVHLTPSQRLKLYEIYFSTMRATHAGQAFDIDGVTRWIVEAVESGDSSVLEQRVVTTHRLKSAIPARSLAMIGCIIGNGSELQAQVLADYFEALGLAFQIIDDVLNLRGFERTLKSTGEDISAGKITLPVAKAIGRLPLQQRQWLWDTLATMPQDREVIGRVIRLIEDCGALELCERQASDLLENAWQDVDALFRDSNTKLYLRAFSWYVLQRHY